MEIYKDLIKREEMLHANASKSINSSRSREEQHSTVRTEFQRDRDRILHSKSFRRLKHKTQVFIAPEGDHFRTRLTHTLEVSQIARTISKALNLNEDLTEAIALGHDLGHTPFGHMGEKILNNLSDIRFRHYEHSLRVVDKLEYDGKGLNLTNEVKDGILKHSKGLGDILSNDPDKTPGTPEGQIVRISDIIAYVNHDIDDSLRAGLITLNDIPENSVKVLGTTYAKRINTIVVDIIKKTIETDRSFISISSGIYNQLIFLRKFLFDSVYLREDFNRERGKTEHILAAIYEHVKKRPEEYINPFPEEDSTERRIVDFIAGMTDTYAINLFKSIVFPKYIY